MRLDERVHLRGAAGQIQTHPGAEPIARAALGGRGGFFIETPVAAELDRVGVEDELVRPPELRTDFVIRVGLGGVQIGDDQVPTAVKREHAGVVLHVVRALTFQVFVRA